jgi:hypothetical protein
MWFQRSFVVMQGSSLLGVSFTWVLHEFCGAALAEGAGAIASTTIEQAATAHELRLDPMRRGMSTSPFDDPAGAAEGRRRTWSGERRLRLGLQYQQLVHRPVPVRSGGMLRRL